MNAVTPSELKKKLGRKPADAAAEERLRVELGEQEAAAAGQDGQADAPEAPDAASADAVHPAPAAAVSADARHAPAPAAGMGAVPAQLAGVEVTLSVEVGTKRLTLRELLNVEPGTLFALDRMTNEPVTVLVNGRAFAHGEIVSVDDRFGVRLVAILPDGAE